MKKCPNKHCENGYFFDTLHACNECDKGKKIQRSQDKRELANLEKRIEHLIKKLHAFVGPGWFKSGDIK